MILLNDLSGKLLEIFRMHSGILALNLFDIYFHEVYNKHRSKSSFHINMPGLENDKMMKNIMRLRRCTGVWNSIR